MGGLTAKVFVVRMPSGNFEFDIIGPMDPEQQRFYLSAEDVANLCKEISEILTEK